MSGRIIAQMADERTSRKILEEVMRISAAVVDASTFDWKAYFEARATGYIDMMGFKISRKCVTVRSRIFLRARRTSIEILKAERTGKQISLKKARTMTSRYGWLENSDTKHFCKRNGIYKAMEIANKIIGGESHAENEVRHANARDSNLRPRQWQAGCCNPC